MYFRVIADHRCQVDVIHPLLSILKLTMVSALCGIDELDKIVDYGKAKLEFLSTEYDIQAIASKSTLIRVFAMINPLVRTLRSRNIKNNDKQQVRANNDRRQGNPVDRRNKKY